MKTYPLTVASPDGNLFQGAVAQLILRGSEGDLAVMAGHIPFMTAVQPGACRIELEDGTVKHARTDGGLLTVAGDAVTLLSESFCWTE